MNAIRTTIGIILLLLAPFGRGVEQNYRLVFGSFESAQNARNWADQMQQRLHRPIAVNAVVVSPGAAISMQSYRVVSQALTDDSLTPLMRTATAQGLQFWRLAETNLSPSRVAARRASNRRSELDTNLGLQSRGFARTGSSGQSSVQTSVSLEPEFYRSFGEGTDSVTFSPFLRYDSQDSHRTHADIRQLYWNRTGKNWDLRVGIQQVFWGVTEFRHLIDIINQTDLVEDIDEEDKLGQPMVNLSVVRDWGIVDLFLLTGFRERTFPGDQGRFRYALPIAANHASYSSGAKNRHLDAAVRWSQVFGPLELGLYQFYGTSREPQLRPWRRSDGRWELRPHYALIDQTGLDAQAIFGDWALKLEALRRTGDGDRYFAFTSGFERTLVGIFDGRTDLGVVAEYMYDSRGDAAPTLYEHDLALGARWNMNDISDSQALFGAIWDVQTDEIIYSLEASRQLGDSWKLLLESRFFTGARSFRSVNDIQALESLNDFDNKSATLQRDDYIQLELTRFF